MERAQVPYFLGGSLASSLQGEPRSTNDIDFVVDLRAPQVQPLIDALGADFDADEEALREAVARRGSWNIYHPEDTVLRKLMWFRDGGEVSTSQWRDIVQVLRVSAGKLDDSYLDEWSGRLGVAPLLAKAREAAG
jgi:hypothetical protein